MKIILDIETNTNHDNIWMCVTRELETDKVIVWKEATGLQKYLENCDLIIMHNGISFDAQVLKTVWKVTMKLSQVCDTLVLSRLLNPSREGGHSLEAWGERLGFPKGNFSDWEGGATQQMEEYCIQDTLVTKKLFMHLMDEVKFEGFSERSITLEHNVQAIITQQEKNGFKFNLSEALHLLAELKAKLDAIQVEMQRIFPPRVESGRISKLGKPLKDIVTPFNPGSRKQIGERLIEKGWKPQVFTEGGQAKVDETTLEGIDIPEAKAIAEFLMLQKRIAQIESWVDALGDDDRVHGRVITNGAVTGRMTHHSPNMAQVPNSGSPYGEECRNLWTVEKGNSLVGIDASGLELRMLAHYMNDNAYTTEVVSGDIHTANQKAAGLETRNQAKTFIYAFLYGAGAAKIGSVVGGSAKEGQRLIDSFLQNTPKLKALREKVARIFAKEAKLPGLDGRKLLVRSEHSALNTLLQGAGAIVMKEALVILTKRLTKEKIWFKFVANVHDEIQTECRIEDAEKIGRYGVEAIEQAGKSFNMNCPLTGEYKIGTTWKHTH